MPRNAMILIGLLLIAACNPKDMATNKGYTSYCFTVGAAEGDSPAALDEKARATCEKMGRKGTPEIRERTKTAIAGYCPE